MSAVALTTGMGTGLGVRHTSLGDAAASAVADRRASLIFVHAICLACICLQRFCIYVGESPIYVALPIFLVALAWLLATGRAAFRPLVVVLFVAVAVAGIASTLVALNAFDVRVSGLSAFSLLSLLVLYIGLTLRPTARFDGSVTFPVFLSYIRLCAVLGIVQYWAQFVGMRLFSFMLAVPALRPVLAEPLFNYQPIIAYGSTIMRSNGFFLVEPSMFSQLLVLGIIIDFFVRREWRFLPLYGLAYLYTYAGTGLLSLGVAGALFIVIAPRQSPRVLVFVVIGMLLAGVASLAFPAQFAQLAGRSNELNYAGSSGYARYMSQFDILRTVQDETRTLIGYGPGALERAIFYAKGGGSAVLKLYVDYGIAGLIAFTTFITATLWRREIALVSIYVLVNFQLGGGYLVFPPLVILMLLVCVWSRETSGTVSTSVLDAAGIARSAENAVSDRGNCPFDNSAL